MDVRLTGVTPEAEKGIPCKWPEKVLLLRLEDQPPESFHSLREYSQLTLFLPGSERPHLAPSPPSPRPLPEPRSWRKPRPALVEGDRPFLEAAP